jgi:PAS domain-containing protein
MLARTHTRKYGYGKLFRPRLTLPAMMWTAAPDGRIDFVNRRWSDYTGLSLDEAHGWEWQALVNAERSPQSSMRGTLSLCPIKLLLLSSLLKGQL